jgi:hypothetical protein
MSGQTWPVFADEAGRFFSDHLRRPRRLLDEFTAVGDGSGRRKGPRDLLWQSVAAFAVAALEAGLEDLIFAAHAARLGCEGHLVEPGKNSPTKNPRSWLVESRLMAPGATKVEQVLFADFGLLLDKLPTMAGFHLMTKTASHAGAGSGTPKPGPTTWSTLRPYLETLSYIRNATAHADASRLRTLPTTGGEGALWLRKKDGTWSVQQPHGLTALRVSLAIYNTVAEGLRTKLGLATPLVLTAPDTLVFLKPKATAAK